VTAAASWVAATALALGAAQLGGTRLIDNVEIVDFSILWSIFQQSMGVERMWGRDRLQDRRDQSQTRPGQRHQAIRRGETLGLRNRHENRMPTVSALTLIVPPARLGQRLRSYPGDVRVALGIEDCSAH
jgi:hypothetical protein